MFSPEELVKTLRLEGLLEQLEARNSFESRVQITLQAIESGLPLNLKCEQKNCEESLELRRQADQLFIKDKSLTSSLLKTWELYCKSISRAEKSSSALAQAYANRSAVLFKLYKPVECIRDIDRALSLNYPDHLKPSLLRRKAKCLKILGNKKAEEVCEEARILLQNVSLSEEKKEKLEEQINKVKKVTKFEKKLMKPDVEVDIILPKFISNERIPSASKAIDIEYNKEFGKHLIANRDISTGEVLILEKPYVSSLKSCNLYTHCSHCLQITWDSIPCEHCMYAMYCSKKCRNEAWTRYHDIECPIRGCLLAAGMKDLQLISLKLAIIAVREAGNIQNLRKELENIDNCSDPLEKILSKDGSYLSNKYSFLYCLVTHEESRELMPILTVTMNAAFVVFFIFAHTTFFGTTTDKTVSTLYKNEDAMFFAKIIVKNIFVAQFNIHELSEFHNGKHITLGDAIGATTSLLNHSCNPNSGRCPILKNNTLQYMIYALHPIKKGSQIFDDYGCNFGSFPKLRRDMHTKPFGFNCSCIACSKNWPLIGDLPSILTIVTDEEPQLEVARAIIRSKKYEKAIREKSLEGFKGDKNEILSTLATSVTILSKNTSEPSKEYYELLDLYRSAILLIYGTRFKLPRALKLIPEFTILEKENEKEF